MADITVTAAQVAPVFTDEAEIYDMIAAVAITAGQAVYQNTAGKAALADANAGSGAELLVGIALNAAGAGQAVSVLKRGALAGYTLSGVAYGGTVYLSDTAGALADAPSTTKSIAVGKVQSMSNSDLTKVLYVETAWVRPSAPAYIFVSTEQTGTGSAQNVAHGLGVIPNQVLVSFTELPAGLAGGADVAEGSHTTTNVVLTVTNGLKFKVLAIA